MKYYLIIALFIATGFNLKAQVVLNGHFEDHSFIACELNCPNSLFNSMMQYTMAFGPASEIDVQNSFCGYGHAHGGDWFVSLATTTSENSDRISLELSEPLIIGQTYRITYFQKADTNFADLDSLLVGVSSNAMDFGLQIHVSQPMHESDWEMISFIFTAPNNASHITFSNQGLKVGWNFLDDVQIKITTDIEDHNIVYSIYPNPCMDFMQINSEIPINSYIIYSLKGQIIKGIENIDPNYVLDVSMLNKGSYILELKFSNGTRSKRIIIKN